MKDIRLKSFTCGDYSQEDILAVKFFEGFLKVKDYTSSRIFLVASHAWLYPQFESIS